ncbi:hypothetical protein GCM10008096_08930 [Zhihengliuella salsuginis]|uniref:DUF4229 domain-containing protein n=1 Tax=Zhihengliuella salsuginis TaxID=578222 RepID=A0ABQ3GFT6_9MICC|nr:hypothetical protein GCM10008096_08930 [Zhihengliuella salsuginis]
MKFTLLRLALFAAVFSLIYWVFGWNLWIGAGIGLVFAFAISYLFFNGLRLSASEELAARVSGRGAKRNKVADEDAAAEDAAAEAAERDEPERGGRD